MILLTGSSGFLGRIILSFLGVNDVKTLNRDQSDYSFNLSSEIPIFKESFNAVIHAAGKAHSVPDSHEHAQEFFATNLKGTRNLLQGLDQVGELPQYFVFISSVAVYGMESGININEDSPLNAKDAYGKSKIEAEQIIMDWCAKNCVKCTILRLPLIVGPNPPGNLGAMINGIKKGYYFNIAGGKAKKSMVLGKDVAAIIPQAAKIGGIYNLTDGYHPSFKELSLVIAKQLNLRPPLNLPVDLAKLIAFAGDVLGNKAPLNSKKLNKITTDLTFSDSKARDLLGWAPKSVIDKFDMG